MDSDSNTTSKSSGGSLLLAWQLKNKRVLIVGGGDVASGRIESVLVADAFITLISPRQGLHPLTKKFIDNSDRITYHDRLFSGVDELTGVNMVLTAIDNVERSREICDMCRQHKIPVNVADIPPLCDFYFGSQIRDGALQIMISTNGHSPKLANLIKKKIEQCLPAHAGEAVAKVGALRAQLKERAPGVGGEIGKKRMKWMVDVCNAWEMSELASLDDTMIKRLLDDGWEKGRIPQVEDVGGQRRQVSKGLSNIQASVLHSTLGFIAGVACVVLFMARRP